MIGIHDFTLFLTAGVLLNLTPGQDTMFILGQSLAKGRRAGIASAFGITVGSIVHTVAAALGLSAVLAASETAFTVVRLAGAAYLCYLGARMLFAPAGALVPPAAVAAVAARERAGSGASLQAFRRGILTNVLNPKVALFFLAFLPQFIDPQSPTKTLAFLVLGATFVTTGTLWCLVLATAAASLRSLLLARRGLAAAIDRAAGALFIALGIRLAISR
jgi:RhtB (resistance to homoserine/threonine) family protein